MVGQKCKKNTLELFSNYQFDVNQCEYFPNETISGQTFSNFCIILI